MTRSFDKADPDDPTPVHDAALLDEAVAALLAEEIPPGPPEAVAARLQQRRPRSERKSARRSIGMKLLPAAVAVLLLGLVGAWLVLGPPGNVALADVAREFHRAKSIQFRIVSYWHQIGEGKDRWRVVSVADHNFRSPGFFREVNYDHEGVPWQIKTRDAVRGVTLELQLSTKTATLTEEGPALESMLEQGIDSNFRHLESWLEEGTVRKELGTRQIDGRAVVGLRVAKHGYDEEADIWIERGTRRIVRFQSPPLEVYDPDKDPAAQGPVPPGTKIVGQDIRYGATVYTDILYDPPLDVAQYVLTPPADFEVNRIQYRMPTEKDLVEWLEVFAHVRGGTFSDDENPALSGSSEQDAREAIAKKPAADRTKWEQALVANSLRNEEFPVRGGASSVLVTFHFTHRDTWHYQGKGVRLGDADTAVCWYRPKGSETYRVVYGDLTIRDVSPQDLPWKKK